MKSLSLTAIPLKANPGRNKFLLTIDPSVDPNKIPAWDHPYATLDELCAALNKCQALDARVMEILRSELGKGRLYMADIREEQARCMGFEG
jgi:hypothetical protein